MSIANSTLILLFLAHLDRLLVDDKLVLHMVLEPHDHVVPHGSEPMAILTHLSHNACVHMSIEMPTLNVSQVFTFDGDCEAHRDDLPRAIICRVSKLFVLVKGWEDSLMMDNI